MVVKTHGVTWAEETMLKDQTADFVSSLAALLRTNAQDKHQPAEGEGSEFASSFVRQHCF